MKPCVCTIQIKSRVHTYEAVCNAHMYEVCTCLTINTLHAKQYMNPGRTAEARSTIHVNKARYTVHVKPFALHVQ